MFKRRIVLCLLTVSWLKAVSAQLVINEIDYDQPSIDVAEFIELKNTGNNAVALDSWTVELFNGSVSSLYKIIDLPAINLAPGDYFVICGDLTQIADCDLDVLPDTDLLQNGAPDAAGLRNNGVLIDAVSYEGDSAAPYTEGSGIGLIDNPALVDSALSRFPDGSDSNRNNLDFSPRCSTPGSVNTGQSTDCALVVTPIGSCGETATLIHDIQGSGSQSPLLGSGVTIEGVVTGDFQDPLNQLGGFFMQEENTDSDADNTTSEGIFVFDDGFGVDVAPGQRVRVQGQVSEQFGLTQLSNVTGVIGCSGTALVSTTAINLPVSALSAWEASEGMLISFPQTLLVSDHFNLGRFGELTLSAGARLQIPTHITTPGLAANALQALNDRNQILLDDGSTRQWLGNVPYLDGGNTRRLGDSVTGLTGILSFGFSSYRLQPTQPPLFTAGGNPRSAVPPPVGGNLKLAAFNVLNYFTTIDNAVPGCGPAAILECRGADSVGEFNRQRDKIIAALATIDADIVGLIEIENNAVNSLQNLTAALNSRLGAGTYTFVDTGTIGTDAIKVGLLYKPAVVSPQGSFRILDSSVDASFLDSKNRPALAQTFRHNASAEIFTVSVNHFKSKGSDCNDVADPDTGDGQGNCNGVRTAAANALSSWLAGDPTASGDGDFLIIGDLNSYAMENPITALESSGYTDLIETYLGTDAYSFVFFGQSGYLDHALASSSLLPQVSGVTLWHSNADEPRALDYNDAVRDAGETAGDPLNPPPLYQANAYRASDHDPLIIGLQFGEPNGIFSDQFETTD